MHAHISSCVVIAGIAKMSPPMVVAPPLGDELSFLQCRELSSDFSDMIGLLVFR